MSNINQAAALRITQGPFGQALLEAFQSLEQELKKTGGTGFFGQIQFLHPGDPLKEGDLLPSIHLSLQPFQPVLSNPVELDEGNE